MHHAAPATTPQYAPDYPPHMIVPQMAAPQYAPDYPPHMLMPQMAAPQYAAGVLTADDRAAVRLGGALRPHRALDYRLRRTATDGRKPRLPAAPHDGMRRAAVPRPTGRAPGRELVPRAGPDRCCQAGGILAAASTGARVGMPPRVDEGRRPLRRRADVRHACFAGSVLVGYAVRDSLRMAHTDGAAGSDSRIRALGRRRRTARRSLRHAAAPTRLDAGNPSECATRRRPGHPRCATFRGRQPTCAARLRDRARTGTSAAATPDGVAPTATTPRVPHRTARRRRLPTIRLGRRPLQSGRRRPHDDLRLQAPTPRSIRPRPHPPALTAARLGTTPNAVDSTQIRPTSEGRVPPAEPTPRPGPPRPAPTGLPTAHAAPGQPLPELPLKRAPRNSPQLSSPRSRRNWTTRRRTGGRPRSSTLRPPASCSTPVRLATSFPRTRSSPARCAPSMAP